MRFSNKGSEQDEAATVRKGSLDDYSSFKSRVLLTTVGLVVGGGVVTSATKGFDVAFPYTTGGVIGILYQWLLQKGVDMVKPQTGTVEAGAAEVFFAVFLLFRPRN